MNATALITVKEVAEMLGLSERTIYRLSDAGDMPNPVKLGAAVRWRKQELETWIDNGCPTNQNGKKPKKRK